MVYILSHFLFIIQRYFIGRGCANCFLVRQWNPVIELYSFILNENRQIIGKFYHNCLFLQQETKHSTAISSHVNPLGIYTQRQISWSLFAWVNYTIINYSLHIQYLALKPFNSVWLGTDPLRFPGSHEVQPKSSYSNIYNLSAAYFSTVTHIFPAPNWSDSRVAYFRHLLRMRHLRGVTEMSSNYYRTFMSENIKDLQKCPPKNKTTCISDYIIFYQPVWNSFRHKIEQNFDLVNIKGIYDSEFNLVRFQ